MKKRIFLSALVAIIVLTHHTHLSSMSNELALSDYQHASMVAAEYNCNNPLLLLPTHTLQSVITKSIDTKEPLKEIIEPCLTLSSTCKRFNAILPLDMIGKACQGYTVDEKDTMMNKLLWRMNPNNYWNIRRGAFLLVYAGADNAARKDVPLLLNAVDNNDKELIATLFAHGANPNQKSSTFGSILCRITDAAIAQMFIDKGANIHTYRGPFTPNILWLNILHHPSPDVIQLYLNHNVNVKAVTSRNGDSLLHFLVGSENHTIQQSPHHIKIAQLLLKNTPDLVNLSNKKNETPFDIARALIKTCDKYSHEYKRLTKLITLFQQYTGPCIICLDSDRDSNMMSIPCTNIHPDRICIGCYSSSLKFSDKCPLCRVKLS